MENTMIDEKVERTAEELIKPDKNFDVGTLMILMTVGTLGAGAKAAVDKIKVLIKKKKSAKEENDIIDAESVEVTDEEE